MRVAVIGTGAVGARCARQLVSSDGVDGVVLIDRNAARAAATLDSLGDGASVAADLDAAPDLDAAVLAIPPGDGRRLAERCLERGISVVSTTDDLDEVRSLLDLDAEARARDLAVVIGAGLAPGLGCVLARHASTDFDTVDEIHVAKAGTAGPACAAQHHRALAGRALDWRDGGWQDRSGGSGRELAWFPDPVGGLDCYRAALPDALLLAPAFPTATRITARVAATRRDRLTAHLPMLRRPHAEGAFGAVRVEVRGRRGTVTDTRVLGAVDRPGVAAGAVAALAALLAVRGELRRAGAAGLADLVAEPVPFLADLAARGVKAAVFEGAGAA